MGNHVLNREERMNLAKKHKKLFEDYSITQFAYKLNDQFFYSAFYKSKFSTMNKAEAVVSADTRNKDDLMEAFNPLVFYALCINMMEEVGEERANLGMQVFRDITNYLDRIVKADVLDKSNQIVYERALKNMQNMLKLQDDMVQLYNHAMKLNDRVLKKGFFTDEELDKLAGYLPRIEIIQYNQGKDRYKYRHDFDIIYKNRNHSDIKPFDRFSNDAILEELTSDKTGKDLEKSLKYLSDNKDISDWTEEEHYQWLKDKLKKSAELRIEKLKRKLRYP